MPNLVKGLRERVKVGLLRSFARLRRLAVGPYGAAVLTRTANGLLLAPTSDVMVGRRLSFNGSYDLDLLSILLKVCETTSEVLFVGAHVGALAIPVAKRVRRVVAVEANPATYELLRMNVALNGLHNVETHNFAAGDFNDEISFLTSGLNSGGSGIQIGEWQKWAYTYDKPQRINVPMRKLDTVFPEGNFDLIVMDIEGSEALALRGMSALVSRSRGLLVEVFERHLRDVAKISNEEFLSLVGPHFDEAFVLTEKPKGEEGISSGPYAKPTFPDMMLECCRRGMTNVMFLKTSKGQLS